MSKTITDVSNPDYWEYRYKHRTDNWDLGTPTPVFEELLNSDKLENSGKIVVIGCGRGHDAILFAKNNYLVTAIDFSASAIRETRKHAKKAKVHIETIEANIFELPGKLLHKFDYVLEYVTYCAIEPERRIEFLDNIQRMLKPGGIFIGLFFPIDKRDGGPPFAVDIKEIESHLSKTLKLIYSEIPKSSVKPRLGKEMLMLWKKGL